jgi:hypothetical protein
MSELERIEREGVPELPRQRNKAARPATQQGDGHNDDCLRNPGETSSRATPPDRLRENTSNSAADQGSHEDGMAPSYPE